MAESDRALQRRNERSMTSRQSGSRRSASRREQKPHSAAEFQLRLDSNQGPHDYESRARAGRCRSDAGFWPSRAESGPLCRGCGSNHEAAGYQVATIFGTVTPRHRRALPTQSGSEPLDHRDLLDHRELLDRCEVGNEGRVSPGKGRGSNGNNCQDKDDQEAHSAILSIAPCSATRRHRQPRTTPPARRLRVPSDVGIYLRSDHLPVSKFAELGDPLIERDSAVSAS